MLVGWQRGKVNVCYLYFMCLTVFILSFCFISLSLTLTHGSLFLSKFSLIATIAKSRPELLQDMGIRVEGKAIPEAMPTRFQDRFAKRFRVVDIGEPVSACFMTGTRTNPTNW